MRSQSQDVSARLRCPHRRASSRQGQSTVFESIPSIAGRNVRVNPIGHPCLMGVAVRRERCLCTDGFVGLGLLSPVRWCIGTGARARRP